MPNSDYLVSVFAVSICRRGQVVEVVLTYRKADRNCRDFRDMQVLPELEDFEDCDYL